MAGSGTEVYYVTGNHDETLRKFAEFRAGAFHLGKPVLALPEPGNWEQRINAHFVAESGFGESLAMGEATPGRLRGFLDGLETYRNGLSRCPIPGNVGALEAIRPFLG